ncbi:hypothetical protein Daus18300_003301 [Diaporthe australafricana]|uniref:Uncharacterized protein n=1 Tax=Diaporthe australafricana TaxID=127596 RepID=A0ABR3XGZ8_9PEZI
MADSSNSTVQAPANPFSTKSDEAKTTSYMWYIHVLVRVNTEDRLRHNLAPFLDHVTSTVPPPPYSPPLDINDINSSSSSSNTPGNEGGDGPSSSSSSRAAAARTTTDDLTDYLILRHFSRSILGALVDTAPVREHTDGYAQVLAGIPAPLRAGFCRRLYSLLFSRHIVEWPPGIDVPEPAPGSVSSATSAAAAPSGTSTSASAETAVGAGAGPATAAVGSASGMSYCLPAMKEEDGSEDGRFQWPTTEDEHMSDDDDDDDDDDDGYHVDDGYYVDEGRASHSPGPQPTLGPRSSPRPDTSSPLGYSPEQLARAAYFGTVSGAPLPVNNNNYLSSSNWRLSGWDGCYGPARDAYAYAGAGAGAGAATPPAATRAAGRDGELVSLLPNSRQPYVRLPHAGPQQNNMPASPVSSAVQQQQQQQFSHTGPLCSCCVRAPWWNGEGGQR